MEKNRERRKDRNKTLDIIVSVIVAVVLWFYVINIINPPTTTTIREIPVVISGEDTLADRGLAVAGSKVYTVDVKITGTRKDVAEISAADIAATSNIASLTQGNTYMEVKVSVPRDITVEDIIDENIEVKVEELVTEPRAITMIPMDAGDGFETTVISLGAETAYVKGAKSDVAGVARVRTEVSPDILETDKINTVEVDCVPIDSEGNPVGEVSLVSPTVSYEACVYHTKIVQLYVPLIGESLYGAEGIEKTDAPTAVTIKGSEENLANISVIEAQPIDVTGISEDTSFSITAILPEGIYLSRKNQTLKANIIISEQAKAAYEEALKEAQQEETASGAALQE